MRKWIPIILLILPDILLPVAPARGNGASVSVRARIARLDSLLAAGRFSAVRDSARALAHAARMGADPTAEATAELRLSDAFYYLGRKEQTRPPLLRALDLFTRAGDLAGIGRTYYSLAYFYERADPDSMLLLLGRGAAYADSSADRTLAMNIANARGVALWSAGRYDAAAQALQQSCDLARQLDNDRALASASQNLALIHYHRGNALTALDHYRDALEALQKAGNLHGQSVVLGNMANALGIIGRSEEALDCYRRSLAIDRQTGYRRGEAMALGNMAPLVRDLDGARAALPLLERALALSDSSGDKRSVVSTLTSLADVYTILGDTTAALSNCSTAHTMGLELKDPFLQLGPLHQEARLALARGQGQRAESLIIQGDSLCAVLGDTYRRGLFRGLRGDVAAAAGQPARAATFYHQAISLHRRTRSRGAVFAWHAAAAEQEIIVGDSEAAETDYRTSLKAIDDLDALVMTGDFRVSLFRQVANIYRDYAMWQCRQGRPERAWQTLERGRARDLYFHLLTSPGRGSMTREEQEALARISSLQKRLRQEAHSPAQRAELDSLIMAAEVVYDRTRWRPAGHPDRDHESFGRPPLRPGELTVQYAVVGDSVLVMAADPEGCRWRLIPGAEALLDRCRLFAELAATPALAESAMPAARSLGETLLGPELAEGLPDRLTLLPDAELWRLPFAALTTPSGQPLGAVTEVALTPATGITAELATRPRHATRSVLAVGCSRCDQGDLPPLPLAPAEARLVADLGGGSALLIDPDETAFLAAEPGAFRLIHFAAHALVNTEHPHRSAIALNPTDIEDGLLQAREIRSLDLNARLVAISGCRSGDGQAVSGEGLLGLGHAFLSAGARSVLLNRWPLADADAARFMARFTAALPGNSAGQALAAARRACLANPATTSPTVWAGWVLIGDASARPLPHASRWRGLGGLAAILAGLLLLGIRLKKFR